MKPFFLTAIIPLIFLISCAQNSKITMDSSDSNSQAISGADSRSSVIWVEAQKVEWRDADGIYWKFSDCYNLMDCKKSILLSSKDEKNWVPGKSWKGMDAKRYWFAWGKQKSNDAESPFAYALEMQSSDDGKASTDSWKGLDGRPYQLGPGGSVWTTQL